MPYIFEILEVKDDTFIINKHLHSKEEVSQLIVDKTYFPPDTQAGDMFYWIEHTYFDQYRNDVMIKGLFYLNYYDMIRSAKK